ncbi:MAG: penicillin-binding protein activator [Methylobacteriaceae bacterium]|nr:penicillin-binding protein activator [Methylobacteriaceae bacterium]
MRRGFAVAATMSMGVLLAGCGQFGGYGPREPTLSAPTTPVQSQPLGPTSLGNGPVHIALILPLGSSVGTSLRNAAEISLAKSGSTELTISVKDDRSTPEGAREAAQQAIAEGDELIIGPLFANSVREVAGAARVTGRPVIAFSTDANVASRGVYLLSFLIEGYVDRIIGYAAASGKKSFAALVPDNEYGNVALAEFQQEAARLGVRVAGIERFSPGNLTTAVQHIASLGNSIDALFIPDQADAMPAVAQALTANGIDSKRVQILGTGVWNDPRVLRLAALQGAWFSSPENSGFNSFAQQYRAKYGAEPARIASLAYDAVSLVAALARVQGGQRYSESVLTNPQGFIGIDGVFRFRSDGQSERGLAVEQIGSGSTTTISAAPRTFTGSGT